MSCPPNRDATKTTGHLLILKAGEKATIPRTHKRLPRPPSACANPRSRLHHAPDLGYVEISKSSGCASNPSTSSIISAKYLTRGTPRMETSGGRSCSPSGFILAEKGLNLGRGTFQRRGVKRPRLSQSPRRTRGCFGDSAWRKKLARESSAARGFGTDSWGGGRGLAPIATEGEEKQIGNGGGKENPRTAARGAHTLQPPALLRPAKRIPRSSRKGSLTLTWSCKPVPELLPLLLVRELPLKRNGWRRLLAQSKCIGRGRELGCVPRWDGNLLSPSD